MLFGLFGNRKRQEDAWERAALELKASREALDGRFAELAGQIEQMGGRMTELAGRAEQTDGRMAELLKMQKRQSMTVEDFLDELQERSKEREELQRYIKEGDEREKRLLALICCGREQLCLIQKAVLEEHREDPDRAEAWREQFRLMGEEAGGKMRACALEETGRAGESVDFDVHEVLNVVDTEDENLAHRVAEVFAPGCVYHGMIIKKARVAAYRRINDGDDHRD